MRHIHEQAGNVRLRDGDARLTKQASVVVAERPQARQLAFERVRAQPCLGGFSDFFPDVALAQETSLARRKVAGGDELAACATESEPIGVHVAFPDSRVLGRPGRVRAVRRRGVPQALFVSLPDTRVLGHHVRVRAVVVDAACPCSSEGIESRSPGESPVLHI